MDDRRASFRRRTLLEGRIEIEKLNGWAVDCTIRNVSDEGAKIVLPEQVVVPPTFHLSVSGDVPRPVRLVWVRDGQAGVTLVD